MPRFAAFPALLDLAALRPLAEVPPFPSGPAGDARGPGAGPQGSAAARGINGTTGDDVLIGTAGRDTLSGGAGNDSLVGGGGGDRLTGGTGADVFLFNSAAESAARGGARDTITDFNRDQGDLIDLSALGALTVTGASRFGGTAGEIIASATRGGMLVEVDLDGDLRADFAVMVEGVTSIRASDFAVVTIE